MNNHSDLDLSSLVNESRVAGSPGTSPSGGDGSGKEHGDGVLGIIAQVEAQLSKIRRAQTGQVEQLASLEQRSRALTEAERHLTARMQAIEEKERSVAGRQQEIEALSHSAQERDRALTEERSAIAQRQEEIERARQQTREAQALLDQHWNDLRAERERLNSADEALSKREREVGESAELRARMEKAEANVGDLIAQLENAKGELETRTIELQQAGARLVAIEARMAELETQLASSCQAVEAAETAALEMASQAERERDHAQSRLGEVERETEGLRRRVGALEQEIKAREATLASQEATLRAAREKIAEFGQSIASQAEEIERGSAAMAEVREQREQIERLKEQLAALRLAADPAEAARKDERIRELTEALRQARGQTAGDGDLAERDRKIERLETELGELRAELERARIETTEATNQLEAQRLESSSAAASSARHEELVARIAELESQLCGSTSHGDIVFDAAAVDVEALRSRITELEGELTMARNSQGGNKAQADEMRKKAVRLKMAAEHLRRRKARLARVRQLIEQSNEEAPRRRGSAQAHADAETQMRLAAGMQREREGLNEAARCLAESERTMLRKWARPRAVVTLTWFFILTAMLGAGSWFAADRFFPATIAAQVVIEAQARPGFPLTDEQTASWQTWHEALLADEAFIRTASKRFEDRKIASFADPSALGDYLSSSLGIDSPRDGELVLTLSGTNQTELRTHLDTLGITLVSESRRQAGKRTDGARTELAGERKEGGATIFASISPAPIEDERLTHAGIIFGGAFVVMLMLLVTIYSRLSRAKRVFDEYEVATSAANG